ncbi:MAG: DUF4292 domain-containing protein [Deltaproteobacteria bacterium]|nr:DUF4292 domain-containing protein [Deltaproteobacteria bacterium]
MRVAFALALVALIAACPRPARPPPQLAGMSAEQALSVLGRGAREHVQAIGQVRIEYLAGDGVFNGEADLAVARPGRLRLELRSFFGQPLLALAVDGQRFTYVDNGATAVVRGDTRATRLRQLIPLALPPELAVPLLLGAVPDLGPGAVRYTRPEVAGAVALEQVGADAIWIVEVDERSRALVRVARFDQRRDRQFAVRLRDHAALGGIAFPRSGRIEVAGRAGAVVWRWSRVEVNGAQLDPALWSLLIPAGYDVEEAPLSQ